MILLYYQLQVVIKIENQGYRPYYQPYQPPIDPAKAQARAERKNLFRIGFGLLIYLVVTAVLQVTAVFVCSRVFPTFYYENDYFFVLVTLSCYLIGMPILYGVLGSMPKARPERKKLGAGNWIGFLSISFLLMMVGSLVAGVLMSGLENLRGEEISNAVAEQINSSSPLVNLLMAVVMAPIAEELICRKWIIDRLLPYSEWLAVATSGLLFGLMHGNFYQFFYAALMGVLFGVVYVKTGNILHPILMHGIINFTGSIIAPFIADTLPQDLTAGTLHPWFPVSLLYSLAEYALVICGILFLVRYLRSGKLETKGEKGLSLGLQIQAAWFNWGTVLMVCFCLAQFFFSLFI